jgi:hypothetical protein
LQTDRIDAVVPGGDAKMKMSNFKVYDQVTLPALPPNWFVTTLNPSDWDLGRFFRHRAEVAS